MIRLTVSPSLTPSAIRTLIERRNERFCQAVDEYDAVINFICMSLTLTCRLLRALPDGDDPGDLLQAAAKVYIPSNPVRPPISESESVVVRNDRVPMSVMVAEIRKQVWYKDQIIETRVFEATEGHIGET